jgi:transcriptional regulator GlxA family with amidase domain
LDLQPGDVCIIDALQSYRWGFKRKSIQLALRIPHARVPEGASNSLGLLATRVPCCVATLIGALIRCSFEQFCADGVAQRQTLSNAITGLLQSSWSGRDGQRDVSSRDGVSERLRAVQDYAIAHLGDDTLSPTSIAQKHGISERQLHRLFRPLGVSICRWIRQCRLDRCAADLLDVNQRHRPITDIALRYGFGDSAHFSRVFRAEFEQTPSEFRRHFYRSSVQAGRHPQGLNAAGA